jgi:3',5'-cyclic AMP phosphodiesterase CpdA
MIVAQLSDPHIGVPGTLLYGRVDTADFLARAVAEINRLEPPPDIVVLTGDLVAIGEPAEYDHLRGLLAPRRCRSSSFPVTTMRASRCVAAFWRRRLPPPDGIYPVRHRGLLRCGSSRSTRIPGEAAACCAPIGSPGC